MKLVPWLTVVVWAWASSSSSAGAATVLSPGDCVRVLLSDEEHERWPDAVRSLAKSPARHSAAALIRRMEEVGPGERRLIVKALSSTYDGYSGDVFILEALARLDADPDAGVREAALEALLHSSLRGTHEHSLRVLAGLLTPVHPARARIAERIGSRYAHLKTIDAWGERVRSWRPRDAAEEAASGKPETGYVARLIPLLEDPEPDVRAAAAEALAQFDDHRVNDLLFGLTRDADAVVRGAAHEQLAERGDERAFRPLLELTRAESDDYTRHQRLSWLGAKFHQTHLLEFIVWYKQAGSPDERRDIEYLIQGAWWPMPETTYEALKQYLNDPDPRLRELIWERLRSRAYRQEEALARALAGGIMPLFLVLSIVISALLGLLLFVWGFQILKLRNLVQTLPVTRARSAAAGLAALHGKARAAESGTLDHPMVEADCLYYPGAERRHPEQRFYVEDGTGRILVDPRGAVLMSEDGLVSPDEPVHIIGSLRRRPGGAPDELMLGMHREDPSLFHRLVQRVIRFLAAGSSRGDWRVFFGNPRDFLWIWDDAHAPPFSSTAEVAMLAMVFLFAGAWILVLIVSTLALVDREFSDLFAAILLSLRDPDIDWRVLWDVVFHG